MTLCDIQAAFAEYRASGGKLAHINNRDVFGVSFDHNGKHFFIYSKPGGGIFCECTGSRSFNASQLAGIAQFSGTTSRAVKRWLEN